MEVKDTTIYKAVNANLALLQERQRSLNLRPMRCEHLVFFVCFSCLPLS